MNVYMQINGVFQKIFAKVYFFRDFFVKTLSCLGIVDWRVFCAC